MKLSTKCRKCSVLTLNYLERNIFAKKKQNKTKWHGVGFFTKTGLLPSELLHQIAFWRCYVTNESVKAFQRVGKKSCIELPPESAQPLMCVCVFDKLLEVSAGLSTAQKQVFCQMEVTGDLISESSDNLTVLIKCRLRQLVNERRVTEGVRRGNAISPKRWRLKSSLGIFDFRAFPLVIVTAQYLLIYLLPYFGFPGGGACRTSRGRFSSVAWGILAGFNLIHCGFWQLREKKRRRKRGGGSQINSVFCWSRCRYLKRFLAIWGHAWKHKLPT